MSTELEQKIELLKSDIDILHNLIQTLGYYQVDVGEVPSYPQLVQDIQNQFAEVKSAQIEINETGHSKTVGQWLLGDLQQGNAQQYENSNVIGVVSEIVDQDNYKIQLSGLWENNSLPGDVGDPLYLLNNGTINNEPGTVIKRLGIKTDIGMIVRISPGAGADPSPFMKIYDYTSQQSRTNETYTVEKAEQVDDGNYSTTAETIYTSLQKINDEADFYALLLNYGILQTYEKEGGQMGLALGQDISTIPSLVNEGLFEQTPGGDLVVGNLKTRIEVTDTIAELQPISVISGTNESAYTTTGDTGDLEDSESGFNQSDKIRIVFDGLEIEKNVDAFWHSQTELKFNDVCVPGVIILIYS